MGLPYETLASAKTPDKLEAAEDLAHKAIARTGLPMNVNSIDIAKTQDMMTKTKKSADFVLAFDNKKLTYELRVGSEKKVIYTLDIAGKSDLYERRGLMVILKNKTKLVTASDLVAYD